jgi:hypothetical protein
MQSPGFKPQYCQKERKGGREEGRKEERKEGRKEGRKEMRCQRFTPVIRATRGRDQEDPVSRPAQAKSEALSQKYPT